MTARNQHVLPKAILGAFAAVSLSACVNLTPDIVYPVGTMLPVSASYVAAPDADTAETIRTAKSGDMLFRQTVQNAHVLELQNDIAAVGNISLSVQAREVTFAKGAKFYGAVNVGQYPAYVACSEGRPAVHIPRLNPGAKGSGKVCFELEKIAGKVDLDALPLAEDTYESDKFFFVSDGLYSLEATGTSYQSLARWDPQFVYDVSPPAEFRPVAGSLKDDAKAPEVGLRFVQTADGDFLESVYLVDDQPLTTKADPIRIDPSQSFPFTINEDGATVELLALKDGVLAYRVLSGFDADLPYIMDLPE